MKKVEIEDNFLAKPIIDKYEVVELENKIHYAMEFAFSMKLKIWREGSFREYEGRVTRLDGIGKVIYLVTKDGNLEIEI
nr:YolD-like family protein [Bacillus sp. FJAT-29790]